MGGFPLENAASPSLAVSGSQHNQESVGKATALPEPKPKPKKKICCACPDTKRVRDECIVEHGEDACGKWIEAHLKCLRAEGFNV
ncbi:hypothetical protein CDL15_Pgr002426 [Punica granatum]|uniref:Cytochrome c oxidase copper chaperone 1-like n=2 Tax=Punica granatum TaxID=22663 RepID=A0A218XVN2_PUNGR|nr:hypothetical protein CDL15_Pgr002426 [Punica granatum]